MLPGEERQGPLEDLELISLTPQFPAQPNQFSPLVGAQILSDLRERLLPKPGQLDRTLPKLRRVRCGQPELLCQDDHRLRSGVQESGSGSIRVCLA
jgi:hypothetical protein